jgi:prevent-host-death family protein
VPEVSATDAARNFSDILDAVEHRGERFTIVRRGKVVAQLDPVSTGRGSDVKAMLRRHRPDRSFARDIASVRELLEIEARP